MESAAVMNFNTPNAYHVDGPVDKKGPSLAEQRNNDMLQTPRFGRYNPSVNKMTAPSATLRQESYRTPVLTAAPTMMPMGKSLLYQDVDDYKRINQNPRTMTQYAEPLYGNARGEQSVISWAENKPERPLVVNNNDAIRTQRQRARPCRY
jgi:hypothetical protein